MATLLNGTGIYKGKIKCLDMGPPKTRTAVKNESFRMQANGHAMMREDRDSHYQRLSVEMQEELADLREQTERLRVTSSSSAQPPPKCAIGQSIIQW